MSAPDAAEFAGWLVAGVAFGCLYLWLVSRTVKAITAPVGRTSAILYFALRLALAAGVLWLAALQGAQALLPMLLGFLLARTIIIRRFREAGDGE